MFFWRKKEEDSRGRRKGEEAEAIAVRYLKRRGYEIIVRNFRVRGGEIDIIALKKGVLVFVEVRSREGGSLVSAAESVTPRKVQRIKRAAKLYLAKHPKALERFSVRFDVVTLDGDRVTHHEDCFSFD
ncbi:MAG: YraN family protein [Planctomycetota bacterium]|nr:YraN family protein [Planctomycetota bacterium]